MAISSKDCRAFAENLRELVSARGFSTPGMAVSCVDADELLRELFASCADGSTGIVEAADVLRLADLIDRPTCRNVDEGREFECSECGITWHLLDKEDPCEGWAHVRNPAHCPSCGAEVVRKVESWE